MGASLAIYNPSGQVEVGGAVFGKDVANAQLYRALARHGGFESLHMLSPVPPPRETVAAELLQGYPSATRIESVDILDQTVPAAAGALLRGQADLEALAWLRRQRANDRAYSLMGLVHTLAPPAVRSFIAAAALAPIQPWDAIVCTSPAVQDALRDMFEGWTEHIGARFRGARRPIPQLPLVPLGVDLATLSAQADRPELRAAFRAGLGLAEDELVVLWVGRLSFFEKAFPQPMFLAMEEAARATGAKIRFVMAGWFPAAQHRDVYEAAARAYCPTVPVEFVDGADPEALGRAWSGADIFLSLVDNVQETFGIAPLEAMAARLPVVASDWDGYRYTMRHGMDAFLIPTLTPPPTRFSRMMVERHLMGADTYQVYAGNVAQHTAVHIGRCAEALAALIRSPDLRRRMGEAGRARVAERFDWPVVVGAYRELMDELAALRGSAPAWTEGAAADPVRSDPYSAFAGFASQALGADTRLVARPGGPEALDRALAVQLDAYAEAWRVTPDEARALLAAIPASGASVADVLATVPAGRRPRATLTLTWMAKLGLLDWL